MRPAVLIPMDDASAIAVGRLREELAPAYLLPQQPGALPERVADKAELAEVCAAAGCPIRRRSSRRARSTPRAPPGDWGSR